MSGRQSWHELSAAEMAELVLEYQAKAKSCCESCEKWSHDERAVTAFTHGALAAQLKIIQKDEARYRRTLGLPE